MELIVGLDLVIDPAQTREPVEVIYNGDSSEDLSRHIKIRACARRSRHGSKQQELMYLHWHSGIDRIAEPDCRIKGTR
jgi:hypothetical protein